MEFSVGGFSTKRKKNENIFATKGDAYFVAKPQGTKSNTRNIMKPRLIS